MEDTELRRWLRDTVALKGKKFAVCLKAFDESMIEDLDDLKRVRNSPGGLKEYIPGAIALMIEEALDKSTAPKTEDTGQNVTVEEAKVAITRRMSVELMAPPDATQGGIKAATPFEIPSDKDFFAFLSHKKQNSKLGNVTEGLALRVSGLAI